MLSILVGCGPSETDQLLTQLHDPDVEVRRAAVQSLSETEGEPISIALAETIQDSDQFVRRAAIEALRQRTPPAVAQLPQILPALEDPELSVRLAAAVTIQKLDASESRSQSLLIEALRGGEGGVFLDVAELGPHAKWAVPTLKQLLAHPDTKIRALAAFTLGKLGPAAIDAESALQRATKDQEEIVRKRATQALELIQPTAKNEP